MSQCKKYKIAFAQKGYFEGCYIDYLKTLCHDNGVSIDVFKDDKITTIDFNNYDYVLSDCIPIEGCCKVFHQNSIIYRINKAENIFYKIFYILGHISKIRKSTKLNHSYTKLICVSNEVKRDLKKYYGISEEKLIVAHAGFIPPEQNNDNKPFKNYNEEEVFTICSSALGFVNKGGYTLLRALREFHKMFPTIKIKANIIYPKYNKNLAVRFYVKLFRLSEMVEFFGFQDDINAFYSNAHCVTCQSISEAFGRVVTEAMYQKIPVIIGSNIGATDIIQDGVNGFIFEDGKNAPRNLALKIKEVLDNYNDLEPLVDRAYETSKNTTWENFAKDVFYGLYPEFKI